LGRVKLCGCMSVGCWIKAAKQLNLKEINVPENALGTAVLFNGNPLEDRDWIIINLRKFMTNRQSSAATLAASQCFH